MCVHFKNVYNKDCSIILLIFGGALISINFHLFLSICFYLILFKNIVEKCLGLPDGQRTMKILVPMDTRYTGESPTECSANDQIMMGVENCLPSSEITLYSDSNIKLGLQNLPPLSNNQIKSKYPALTLLSGFKLLTDVIYVAPAMLRKQPVTIANSVTVESIERHRKQKPVKFALNPVFRGS